MPKTWTEKLNSKKEPHRVQPIPAGFAGSKGLPEESLWVSSPQQINELMKEVPKGKLVTTNDLRTHLASTHDTTMTCPVSTGIFVNIAANAAEERLLQGKEDITPYWRTLKAGGFLNEKYPGGIEGHKKLLEQEGFKVTGEGKRTKVETFEKHLYTFGRS